MDTHEPPYRVVDWNGVVVTGGHDTPPTALTQAEVDALSYFVERHIGRVDDDSMRETLLLALRRLPGSVYGSGDLSDALE